jgi:16S rRNA processing protein RimM
MISLGTVAKAIGLAGACAVRANGATLRQINLPADVFVGESESECSLMTIEKVVFNPKGPVCSFVGIDSPDVAETLRGKQIFLKKESLPPLDEGSFYHFELAGLTVKTDTGNRIGVVESVHNFPTIDSIEIRRPNGETIMVPLCDDALAAIDRETDTITLKQDFIDELL